MIPASTRRARSPLLRAMQVSFGCANLGDGITLVLLPLIAAATSRSPLDVALVTVARTAPWAVFAPAIGVLADHVDLRKVLVGANLARAAVQLALVALLLTGSMSIAVLAGCALVVGTNEALYDISAQTALPFVVAAADLERANTRQTTITEVLHGLLGPALGGLLAAIGAGWSSAVCATCYALAALTAMRLPTLRQVSPKSAGRFTTDLKDGLRVLWRDPLLRVFLVMTALGAVAFAGWQPVFSLFATAPGPLGLDGFRFGLVYSAGALGGIATSLAVPWLLRHVPRSLLLAVAKVAGAASLALPVLVHDFGVAIGALACYSASVIVWNVVTVSYRQRALAGSFLGRVNASYRALAWGLLPLGPLVAGGISDVLGSTAAGMLAMAALSAAAALLLPVVHRNRKLLDCAPGGMT